MGLGEDLPKPTLPECWIKAVPIRAVGVNTSRWTLGCGLEFEDATLLSRLPWFSIEEFVQLGDLQLDRGEGGLDLGFPRGKALVEGFCRSLETCHLLLVLVLGLGEALGPSRVLLGEAPLDVGANSLDDFFERELDDGIHDAKLLLSSREVLVLSRIQMEADIVDFFLKNMVNEKLGPISNAHVVHADLSEYGAMDEKCIQLAELAATAVDFPKTGKIVSMPQSLRPKVYPDFMGKDDTISYKSEKILGRLYRSIKEASSGDLISEETSTLNDLPYDTDMEVPGASDFLASAWQCKCSYEAQLNALLNQYGVRSEAELVTDQISSLPKYNSRKQGDIKERLKNAYSALRKEFRSFFESITGDPIEISDDQKNMIYEMRASAWYQINLSSKMGPEDKGNAWPRLQQECNQGLALHGFR
ncbi:hypothetical protein PR202_gb05920 [Eleusine coracana subsp. coracana]|uniref:RNA-dependent RNA polymerase n=1 Tax=Eleusine coracana subsp. coracana TaxID=191504 RepID=A0AAV5E7Y8_ELECO|nr:hypothetical protein PR202_gb05920 [Eleusine coracana subsp. coracana]